MSASRTAFYLDKVNAKWLGVCSGIADYTGIDAVLVRVAVIVLTFMTFPVGLLAYLLVAWLANPRPLGLYDSPGEAKFWQEVRRSPRRSTRDVRASFRDLDRRMAEIEAHYTSRNTRLADEIDSLR